MDIDLDTLSVRYIPCPPLEDGIGFVTLRWEVEAPDGTRVPMRLRQPVLLHHGAFRYEQIQALPLVVIEAMAEAYTTWALQHEQRAT